jgi:hypothetical protein
LLRHSCGVCGGAWRRRRAGRTGHPERGLDLHGNSLCVVRRPEGDLGTISGLPPAEVDASFSDVIENTDVALMLAAEAGRDRWELLLDLV